MGKKLLFQNKNTYGSSFKSSYITDLKKKSVDDDTDDDNQNELRVIEQNPN